VHVGQTAAERAGAQFGLDEVGAADNAYPADRACAHSADG
jgi:hypothetical protein